MKFADYERIKECVGDVYEENADILNTVPIDIFKLASRMGFEVKFATDLISKSEIKREAYFEYLGEKEVFGFTVYDTKRSKFVIYIDDVSAKTNKQRFSLAHEIGHIVLGHKTDSKDNEIEADYFAGYLLCPDCIGIAKPLYNMVVDDPSCLTRLFGIAIDTAYICSDHIMNRHDCNPVKNNYEKIICSCLKQAVLTKLRV